MVSYELDCIGHGLYWILSSNSLL